MSDIVERLRSEGALAGHYDAPAIQREAADEIERLRSERDKYMAAYDAAVDEHLHDQMHLRDAGDEIERLRGLLEEWKEEPWGGIVKIGVVYLSPERVASIVDPLKAERDRLREALRLMVAALEGYQSEEFIDEDQIALRAARAALGEAKP